MTALKAIATAAYSGMMKILALAAVVLFISTIVSVLNGNIDAAYNTAQMAGGVAFVFLVSFGIEVFRDVE